MKPLIIPVFIPNQGCPHRCIFCEQEKITSQREGPVGIDQVNTILEKAIASKNFCSERRPEIAFFGGTFTSLPIEKMKSLLNVAESYLKQGLFFSIRVSTRPDALDSERLKLMYNSGVRTVELGVQSMDDRVLSFSKRGHTARETVKAVKELRDHGFSIGTQLMPGLPGDSADIFGSTVDQVIGLSPNFARLYPAIVIRGTGMFHLYKTGKYVPLSLENAIEMCKNACIKFETAGIPVIRIGLMSSPSLLEKGNIAAGPWHPAFGQLVRSAVYQKKIEQDLSLADENEMIRIHAPKRDMALLRGYRNQGIDWIEARFKTKVRQIVIDETIPSGRICIEKA